MTSTLTTFASPDTDCPVHLVGEYRCVYCIRPVYRASDGNWHHTITGSRKCVRSA